MSFPTDQFASLSLKTDELDVEMSPNEDLDFRVLYLQDLLSSFGDGLPTECEPHIVKNIQDNVKKARHHRPATSDWTISGNLLGTLLQHGTYSDESWEFLTTLKADNDLAYTFEQKMKKRFDVCLQAYDKLVESPPSVDEIKALLGGIIDDLKALSREFAKDQKRRKLFQNISASREASTFKVALDVLHEVCTRVSPILQNPSAAPRRTTRRTASNSGIQQSLFHSLIGEIRHENDRAFMLDTLEECSLQARTRYFDEITAIVELVKIQGAPEAFCNRIELLQASVLTSDEVLPNLPNNETGLSNEPKPGSKRPQSAETSTPKRGKKLGR